MKINIGILLCFPAIVLAASVDPYQRDEDISNTNVEVEVVNLTGGLYKYNYTISSGASNKGEILGFDIDITCDQVAKEKGLPEQQAGPWFSSSSDDNKHSSVRVFSGEADKSAAAAGISIYNWAGWLISTAPGETASGFGLISTQPPTSRQYKLTPVMNAGYPWDYSSVNTEDPDLPWTDDFTVYGTTIGPACSSEPQPNEPRFAGTVMDGESDGANNLLTYSNPLKDRFHVPAGTGQIAISIHYEKYIDPDTFHVTPQRPEYRNLFHPEPGTSETVYVPLSHKKTKLMLRVQPQRIVGQKSVKNKNNQYAGPQDRDVFEIRLTQ